MNQQIRRSVFETNSSSSHSLTLTAGDLVAQPFSADELRRGVVQMAVGEYGWEWQRYYRPMAKLQYLLTQVTNGSISGVSGEFEDNERVKMLCDVVLDHTGCRLELLESSGGIDHQSAMSEGGNGLELFESREKLRDFIFGADSYIETGNDNSAAPWKIVTDRGHEMYYAASIAKAPSHFVEASLTSLGRYGDPLLATPAGGLITKKTSSLLGELLSGSVVVSAELVESGEYRYGDRDDRTGEVASSLIEMGFRLDKGFRATNRFIKREGPCEDVTHLRLLVSPELVAEFGALDPDALRQHKLTQAKHHLKFWQGRVREAKADRPDKHAEGMVKALQAEVDRLSKPAKKAPKKVASKPAAKVKVK